MFEFEIWVQNVEILFGGVTIKRYVAFNTHKMEVS